MSQVSNFHSVRVNSAPQCKKEQVQSNKRGRTLRNMLFLNNKPTRCNNFLNFILEWNSTYFGQFLCPSSGVIHCTNSGGICHTGLLFTVKNDWWWTQELSKTCRVSFQNKIWDIGASSCFYYKKFLTMHGHMSFRYGICIFLFCWMITRFLLLLLLLILLTVSLHVIKCVFQYSPIPKPEQGLFVS